LKKPRNHMRWDVDCMADVLMGFHRSWWVHPLPLFNHATVILHYSCSAILKRAPSKWPPPHLHKVLTQNSKVSPQMLQRALIQWNFLVI
jgi:hypothetical protein